jgi:hypothetical protein
MSVLLQTSNEIEREEVALEGKGVGLAFDVEVGGSETGYSGKE